MLSKLITLAGIVCLVLIVAKLYLGLAVFAIIVPFLDLLPKIAGAGLNMQNLLIFSLFFFAFTRKVPRDENDHTGKYIKYLIIFTTISAFFTPVLSEVGFLETEMHRGVLTSYFNWTLFFFIYYVAKRVAIDDKKIIIVTIAIVLGYFSESAFSFLQYFMKGGGYRLYGRVSENANEFACFLTSYIGFALILCIVQKDELLKHLNERIPVRLFKIFGIATIFVALADIAFSGSRGAYLSLLCVVLGYYYYRSKKKFILALAVVTIVIFNYEIILPEVVVNRINQTFVEDQYSGRQVGEYVVDRSAGSRLVLAKIATDVWFDSPLWGVGYFAMPHHGWEKGYFQKAGFELPRSAHNGYLQVLAEFGIIGFILFFLLYKKIIENALFVLKKCKTDSFHGLFAIAILMMIVSFLISNLFGTRFYNSRLICYFFIAAAMLQNIRNSYIQNSDA